MFCQSKIIVFLLLLLLSVANAQQQKEKLVIVHYGNRTFDVSSFVPFHPGGPLVLQHVNGKDVTEYLAGHKSVKLPELSGIFVQHHHGPGAFHVLNSLEIQKEKNGGSGKGKSTKQ